MFREWPEFHAFMNRMGVDLSRPYRRIVVDMQINSETLVLLQQIGGDNKADDCKAVIPRKPDVEV